MKGIFTILNYYFSPGRRAAQWPLATAPAAVGDRNLHVNFLVWYLCRLKSQDIGSISKITLSNPLRPAPVYGPVQHDSAVSPACILHLTLRWQI